MVKLRTLTALVDYLDKEFAWRIKEIADLKIAVEGTGPPRQRTLIRASVPLLYAHWEGFVKTACSGYASFVVSQGFRLDELSSCFIALSAKKHVAGLVESRKARVATEVVDFFMKGLGERAKWNSTGVARTRANLGSAVFEDIAVSIGLDPTRYESRYKLIDESLLRRRNEIAHGEYLDLEAKDYRSLADETLVLLRWFKTDIENGAVQGSYLREQSQRKEATPRG